MCTLTIGGEESTSKNNIKAAKSNAVNLGNGGIRVACTALTFPIPLWFETV